MSLCVEVNYITIHRRICDADDAMKVRKNVVSYVA